MQKTNKQTRKIALREILTIGVTCIIGWTFSYLATNIFRDYAWGLFIWLPTVMGIISSLILGYKNEVEKDDLFSIAFISLFVFCGGLLLFAWEGLICVIMALPIGAFFTWVGYRIGYALIKSKLQGSTPITIFLFILSVPSLMGFENSKQNKENPRLVTTSIVIKASPDEVWKNVIAFPELKDPTAFIFKTGIAYPINATINGQGVGAVRHCNFSTGSFVEPITVWDEPRLLKFSVDEQPEPMKEISFYDIKPNHLHGYWVSEQGQFKLTRLANGHTLLEGTTWYVNKIKPDLYWTFWSDYIVHKIHLRVLEHIKIQAER
jgi:hypothetical protein